MISINIKTQTLSHQGKSYSISTAKNGVGEVEGSFCTPTGEFRIDSMIGAGLSAGAVLVGRVATGEIYSQSLAEKYPDRDWILSRILWLDGVQAHNQNTKERYIYIHGMPDKAKLGVANSKGCICMHNDDVIALFEGVQIGEDVVIMES